MTPHNLVPVYMRIHQWDWLVGWCFSARYSDVIMDAMESQITGLTIVYWTVYSGADQRKHQSSASLAFVRGIHRWPVNSPHKRTVTRRMFPFYDVIMCCMELRTFINNFRYVMPMDYCLCIDSTLPEIFPYFHTQMFSQRNWFYLLIWAQISFKFFQRHNQSSSKFTSGKHKYIISTYGKSVVYVFQEVTLSHIGSRGGNLCHTYHNSCSYHSHLRPICMRSSQRPPVVCTHSDRTFVWIYIATHGSYSTVHSWHTTTTGTKV